MTLMERAAGMTIVAARRSLAGALRRQQFDTPELDARVLIGHALSLDHAGMIRDANRPLSRKEVDVIAAVAARRFKREPVARIVGVKEFWSLPLSVSAATLVPRPETETVVEAALTAVDTNGGRQRPLRLLDIGTGSGALLLALLAELPKATGVGTDVSFAALEVARSNAVRLSLAGRAGFIACDVAAALRSPFDLIVSNPPYVVHDAIATLAPGVRDYEPHVALDGGTDGLDAHRAIAAQVPTVLAPGGLLVVEIGAGQGAAVEAIMQGHGLAVTALTRDISGILRALTAVDA
ncbi:MAG: peptide chain release factor N(5)-glutamine methyltransferase [Rhizobiales bacterium]|nr:peptide chain release factor N(5)-glutamine methyltransferase [Hyphomicrobiales bacterium]